MESEMDVEIDREICSEMDLTASRRGAAGSIDRPVAADVQRDTRPRHQPTAGVREDLR